MKFRVLVVDDEKAILDSVAAVLDDGGSQAASRMATLEQQLFGADKPAGLPEIELVTCSQAECAVDAVRKSVDRGEPFAVAFVDVRMPPGPDGVWAVQRMRELDQDIELVIMTAYTDIAPQKISQLAPPAGKLLYMQKPFHAKELRQMAAALIDKWWAQRMLRESHHELENRVAERTAELARANQALQKEVERRRAKQEQLERSENNLKMILDSLPVSVAIVGGDKRLRMLNRAALRLMGRQDEGSALGLRCEDTICSHSDEGCPFISHERSLENQECTLMRADGRSVPILKSAVFADLGGEEVLIEAFSDLTERKKWETALNQSEARYRHLVEHAPAGICEIDFGLGQFTSVNDVMLRYTGFDRQEFLGLDPAQFLPPDHGPVSEPGQDTALAETFEVQATTAAGQALWLLMNLSTSRDQDGRVVGRVVAHDITEKKRGESERKAMESRVRQTQKMEALGSLAGGVAHDFNNILNSVIGFTELALRELPPENEVRAYLQHVLQAGKRAGGLVRQILTFSRGGEPEIRPINLVLVVKEVLRLLRASLPSTIEVLWHLDVDEVTIMADPSQVHQVVMNLCTNAAQAMGEGGGLLEVSLQRITVFKTLGLSLSELPPGQYARLSVVDDGPGIPEEDINRLFEPYFTTKGASGGTGLGLAVVHGIVNTLGGQLDVTSRLGAGARFDVYFPVPREAMAEADEDELLLLPTGTERLLLVDDEPALLELGRGILESLGYTVVTAADGEKGLAVFGAAPDAFDLLLTDQTMPRMTGLELAVRARRIKQGLPVVLCTGYSEHLAARDMERAGVSKLVSKPMLMGELAMAVRGALDGN